jgi:hypothetical protein
MYAMRNRHGISRREDREGGGVGGTMSKASAQSLTKLAHPKAQGAQCTAASSVKIAPAAAAGSVAVVIGRPITK